MILHLVVLDILVRLSSDSADCSLEGAVTTLAFKSLGVTLAEEGNHHAAEVLFPLVEDPIVLSHCQNKVVA